MSSRITSDPVVQAMQALEEQLAIPADLEARLLDQVVGNQVAQAMQALEEQLAIPADLEAQLLVLVSNEANSSLEHEGSSVEYTAGAFLSFRRDRGTDVRSPDSKPKMAYHSDSQLLQRSHEGVRPLQLDENEGKLLELIRGNLRSVAAPSYGAQVPEESARGYAAPHSLHNLTIATNLEDFDADCLRIGDKVAQYQIMALLGQGGLGATYSALDLLLRRKVVLELISSELMQGDALRRRFFREVMSAAIVKHPNVATIFDVSEGRGIVLIARECMEGRSLRARMDSPGAPLSVIEILNIARQLARGLAAAHRVGVTHRAIRPESVMIDRSYAVKLVDFGLAKCSGAEGELGAFESQDVASADGHVTDASRYISPEQASGLPVDARSDVFAFGVVLFEMLARTNLFRPFRDEIMTDMLATVRRGESLTFPFLRDDPRNPFARIISRCLEKDSSRRHENACELLADLDAV